MKFLSRASYFKTINKIKFTDDFNLALYDNNTVGGCCPQDLGHRHPVNSEKSEASKFLFGIQGLNHYNESIYYYLDVAPDFMYSDKVMLVAG